jgi:hypothetical protein
LLIVHSKGDSKLSTVNYNAATESNEPSTMNYNAATENNEPSTMNLRNISRL